MPELLGGHDDVVLVAQVAGVLVVVASTHDQRHDVVDDGGCADDAVDQAHLAKAVGAFETSATLFLTGPTAKAFNDHARRT